MLQQFAQGLSCGGDSCPGLATSDDSEAIRRNYTILETGLQFIRNFYKVVRLGIKILRVSRNQRYFVISGECSLESIRKFPVVLSSQFSCKIGYRFVDDEKLILIE